LTAILAPSFYALEWGLVGVTAGLITFLKYRGLSDMSLWLFLWGLNLLFSAAVVLFNDHFRIDLTLMETLRKLTTRASGKSKWAGFLMELAVFFRLLLWDGASQLLIYFRERLPSRVLRNGLFLAASGLQMFIWLKLYSLGYENVGDLLKAAR
jgi:hypothetical protein